MPGMLSKRGSRCTRMRPAATATLAMSASVKGKRPGAALRKRIAEREDSASTGRRVGRLTVYCRKAFSRASTSDTN